VAQLALLVVLPTLGNRIEFLELALRSCQDLAAHLPTTVAMVVPAGAVQARALGTQYGAELIDDPGEGMAGAINAGLAARRAEDFYIWLGDDDELVPRGVVKLAEALERDDDAVVAFGHCDYVDELGKSIARSRAGRLAIWVLAWGPNLIPHPGSVIRLDALEEIGGYSPELTYALDLDVFLRLRRLGDFLSLPAVSARFRWHPDSATVADRRASSREAVRVKDKHLPCFVRIFSALWNFPITWLSAVAAFQLNRRATKKAKLT
jgi:GT2 family glycosyltransferase